MVHLANTRANGTRTRPTDDVPVLLSRPGVPRRLLLRPIAIDERVAAVREVLILLASTWPMKMTCRGNSGGAAHPEAGCYPLPGHGGGAAVAAWGAADNAGEDRAGAGDSSPARQECNDGSGREAASPLSRAGRQGC